jgi:hypothetical protein
VGWIEIQSSERGTDRRLERLDVLEATPCFLDALDGGIENFHTHIGNEMPKI